jgi:hypothetical protein
MQNRSARTIFLLLGSMGRDRIVKRAYKKRAEGENPTT